MDIAHLPQQIKIVFFDIDDTLFDKAHNMLPESVPMALQKLKDKGIIVAIATGRTRCAFPEQVNAMIEQIGIDVFVTMNGQYNLHQNNIVKEYPISTAKIQQLIAFFEQNHIPYSFVTPQKVTVSEKSPYVSEALDPITTHYELDKQYFRTTNVHQMLAYYGEEKDEFVRHSNILGKELKTVRWHENSVDIFAAEGSKARGIQQILAYFNLTPDQALVFGDGLNDIEMFKYVGNSVAMGNAHPSLKQVATFVTDSLAENGIANFLVKAKLIDEN